jgi:hypothetical protein
MKRIMAPFVVPTKVVILQEKGCRGPGVRALWGQQWPRLPFFRSGKKYCHDGGMTFAHTSPARVQER